MPCVMSHISSVQTLVKRQRKEQEQRVLFSEIAAELHVQRPEACLDLRVKSGALVPTDSAIGFIRGF